jgi:hypothetical protein
MGLPAHLVPYWTAKEGLRFVVLTAEAYPSTDAVQSQMDALPTELSARSRIRSNWGLDPVFFASPF